MITLGGNAELELVDSMDPFSEGIIFSVMPPKKSWRNISNLSGGEKTLSSLALVFALHAYKVRWTGPSLHIPGLRYFSSIPSLPRYTSWTRLMPHWISETCQSSRITSKTEPRMHSSSSFLSGTNPMPHPLAVDGLTVSPDRSALTIFPSTS
jgi:hypothetical protein